MPKMTDEAVFSSLQVHRDAGNDRWGLYLCPVRSLKSLIMTESTLRPMREVHIGASRWPTEHSERGLSVIFGKSDDRITPKNTLYRSFGCMEWTWEARFSSLQVHRDAGNDRWSCYFFLQVPLRIKKAPFIRLCFDMHFLSECREKGHISLCLAKGDFFKTAAVPFTSAKQYRIMSDIWKQLRHIEAGDPDVILSV